MSCSKTDFDRSDRRSILAERVLDGDLSSRKVKRSQPFTSSACRLARAGKRPLRDTTIAGDEMPGTGPVRVMKRLEDGAVRGANGLLPLAPLPWTRRPADASNTQSSVIIDISASRSCLFHASAKRSNNWTKSASERGLPLVVCCGRFISPASGWTLIDLRLKTGTSCRRPGKGVVRLESAPDP